MKRGIRTTALAGLLLFGGVALSGERLASDRSRDRGPSYRVSISDCDYARDPDRYQHALRRSIEELSMSTEEVARRVGIEPSHGEKPLASGLGADLPSRGYIDDFVFGKMRDDGVPHAGLAGDAEFFRRVSLDLSGRIPSSAEVRAFLADDSPKKRSDLIQKLLYSREFVDKRTLYLGDLLRNTTTDSNITRYAQGRNAFYMSIKAAVEGGMPYDEFVRRLITASGSTWEYGEGNWLLGSSTPMGPVQDTYDTMAVRSATQFLGLANLDCLLCHSGAGHLDKLNLWAAATQRSQAWEMAAFFSRYRVRRSDPQGTTSTVYYWTITDATTGDYTLNTTSGNRTPRQPVGGAASVRPRYILSSTQASGSTYREMFANNLTRDRQFARATVNYLWKEMMGLGIVEPADQFDPYRLDPSKTLPSGWTVQPSHPQLLEAMADDFISSGFNIRHMLGVIADSNAYQLSSRFPGNWKAEYTAYFARKFVRRLMGEEVHDALAKSTGILGSYTVQDFTDPFVWAMQLPEPVEPRSRRDAAAFMNVFLRGDRDQNLRSDEATIFQALTMMNSEFVLSRIRRSNAADNVAKLLANPSLSDAQVIEELYLATLSRFPTLQEMTVAKNALKANRATGTENLAWVLLNKIDFLYNY